MNWNVPYIIEALRARLPWNHRRHKGQRLFATGQQRLKHLHDVAVSVRKLKGEPLQSLEIGALLGRGSTKTLAEFGQVVSVDTWPWGMNAFIRNTRGMNVVPMRGSTTDILPLLASRTFDIIYIDGDHTYPVVDHDIRQAQRLTRSCGVICGDDLEQQISVAELAEADKYRTQDYVNGRHYGVACAVRRALGDVTVQNGFWYWKGVEA
jgi:hypothetical protein